jgi:hypothetical protein
MSACLWCLVEMPAVRVWREIKRMTSSSLNDLYSIYVPFLVLWVVYLGSFSVAFSTGHEVNEFKPWRAWSATSLLVSRLPPPSHTTSSTSASR